MKLGSAADLCITCVLPVISPVGTVGAGNQLTITYTVANEGPDPSNNVTVTGSVFFGAGATGATLGTGTVGTTGTCSTATNNVVVCQIPTLQSGAVAPVNFTVTPNSVGSYSLMATVASANNTNTSPTATASFNAGGYSVFIAPSAQTVAAGQIAQFGVQVNPTNGVFPANVSFSVSALPSGATGNFTTTPRSIWGTARSRRRLTSTRLRNPCPRLQPGGTVRFMPYG